MSKIKKILIANRGEIACRVMKTARKMGIKTVAVYSDADKKALHTRTADEAVHIGPSPAAESYLVIDKIIAACKETGADAVHPGYGFLSENPEFARRLRAENITFIGPAPESMEAMGLKDAAKKLMVEAGVPVTPGYHGKDQTPSVLKSEADGIGYPVLIKAVAGGGGKGMRKVEKAGDFIASLESCQREARSSFGDDRVLIEKYITSPRHIEVQVFGDTHGNVVHMFERDCSLQRRHQKVIEEAPAPGMTDAVRKAMTDAAVQAAKAVNYVGAGTVEFIVDGSGALKTDGFWFMEMNTRLQVEHPVSEMITGLDFVELQIRVAQGEKLPKQSDITMSGHAIEARLYAEDPANDFLPSAGRINYLIFPWEDRIDAALESTDHVDSPLGQSVSIYYDPMIAKFIAYSNNRKEAIGTLLSYLANFQIEPLKTNAAYLYRVLQLPVFLDGKHATQTLADKHSDVLASIEQNEVSRDIQAILKLIDLETKSTYRDNYKNHFSMTDSQRSYAWRLNQANGYSQTYFCNGRRYDVFIDQSGTPWRYTFNGKVLPADFSQFESEDKLSTLYKFAHTTRCGQCGDVHFFGIEGVTIGVSKYPPLEVFGSNSNSLIAPMPGKIIAVNASVGDKVKAGDPLIIMEAMKMEMTLEAPKDGVVAAVNTETDALVSDGDVLLEMEDE